MTTPTLLCALDPQSPAGQEQSYLLYTLVPATAADGSPTQVRQLRSRGTKTQIDAQVANAQAAQACIAAFIAANPPAPKA